MENKQLFTFTQQGINPLQGARERLQDNPFFNRADWDYIQKGALKGVTLSSYVDTLAKTRATIDNPQQFLDDNFLKYADTETRVGRLMNEAYKDDLSEEDYTHYNEIYLNNAKYGYEQQMAKQAIADAEDAKRSRSFFLKNFATGAGLVMKAARGFWSGFNDFVSFWNGVAAASAQATVNAKEGISAGEGAEKAAQAFVEATDLSSYDLKSNPVASILGDGYDAFARFVEEFNAKYTWLSDAAGNPTGYGKYYGGALEATAQMLPSMLIGKSAHIGKATTALFYAGVMAGDVKESYQTMAQRGKSVPYASLVVNSASKAVAQAAIEAALGGISDKLGFGGRSQLDVLTKGVEAGTVRAKSLQGAAIKRIIGGAVEEGLEEALQDTSDFYINKLFATNGLGYGLFDEDFGQLCVDENGNSVLTLQSVLDSFIIASLMSLGGSAVELVKSEVRRSSTEYQTLEELSPLAYYEYGLAVSSFAESNMKLKDLAEKYGKNGNKRIANAIGTAFGEMYEAYRLIGSVYGELGDERVKNANIILEQVTEKIKEGAFDRDYVARKAGEVFDGLTYVKGKNGEIDLQPVGFELAKKAAELKEALEKAQIANLKKVETDLETAKKDVQELAKETGADVVAITEDGKNVVTTETDDGDVVVIVPERIANLGPSVVANSIAQNKIISSLVKTPSAELKASLNELLKLYQIENPDADLETMVADLLFTDTKSSFFRECLGAGATKEAYTACLEIAKSAIKLKSEKEQGELQRTMSKVRADAYQAKNLKIALQNMMTALTEFYTEHPDVEISTQLFDKTARESIESKRFTKGMSNRLITNGYASLSNSEKEIAVAYVRNAPSMMETEKELLTQYLQSDNLASRVIAVERLNLAYNGSFYSLYDGQFYLQEESYANAAFNTVLKSLGIYAKDFIGMPLYSREHDQVVDAFTELTGDRFSVTVLDSNAYEGSLESPKILLMPNDPDAIDSTPIKAEESGEYRTVVDTTSKSLRWLANKSITTEQLSHLTLTDFINQPQQLLSASLKEAIQQEYGEVTPYSTFMFLRNKMVRGEYGDSKAKKSYQKTIVKLRDGSYAFANLEPYFLPKVAAFVDKGSKFPGSDFTLGDLKFGGIYNSDALKDIKVKIRGGNKSDAAGGFNPETREITIYTSYISPKTGKKVERSLKEQVVSLVHESQHALQFVNHQLGGFTTSALVERKGGEYVPRNKEAQAMLQYVAENYVGVDDPDNLSSEDIVRSALFIYNATGEADARGDNYAVQLEYYPNVVTKNDQSYTVALFDGSVFTIPLLNASKNPVLANKPTYQPVESFGKPFVIADGKVTEFEDSGVCEAYGSSTSGVSYLEIKKLGTIETYTLVVDDNFSLDKDREVYNQILSEFIKQKKVVYLSRKSDRRVDILVDGSIDKVLEEFVAQAYVDSSTEELELIQDDSTEKETASTSYNSLPPAEQSKRLGLVTDALRKNPNAFDAEAEGLPYYDSSEPLSAAFSLLQEGRIPDSFFAPKKAQEAPKVASKTPSPKQEDAGYSSAKIASATKEVRERRRNKRKYISLAKSVTEGTPLEVFEKAKHKYGNQDELQMSPVIANIALDATGKNAFKDEVLREMFENGTATTRDILARVYTADRLSETDFKLLKKHLRLDGSEYIPSFKFLKNAADSASVIFTVGTIVEAAESVEVLKRYGFQDIKDIVATKDEESTTSDNKAAKPSSALVSKKEDLAAIQEGLKELGFTEEKINDSIDGKDLVDVLNKLLETVTDKASKGDKAAKVAVNIIGAISDSLAQTEKVTHKDLDPATVRSMFLRHYDGRFETAYDLVDEVHTTMSSKKARFSAYGRSVSAYNESDISSDGDKNGESNQFNLENVGEEGAIVSQADYDALSKEDKAFVDEIRPIALKYADSKEAQDILKNVFAYYVRNKMSLKKELKTISFNDVLTRSGEDKNWASFTAQNGKTVTVDRVRRRVNTQRSNIMKRLQDLKPVTRKNAPFSKKLLKEIFSIKGFDKYFKIKDGDIVPIIPARPSRKSNPIPSNKQYSELDATLEDLKQISRDIKTTFSSEAKKEAVETAKTLGKSAEKKALQEKSKALKAAEAKVQRLEQKVAEQKEAIKDLRSRPAKTQTIMVERTTVSTLSDMEIPASLQKILDASYVEYAKSNIKAFEDEDLDHLSFGDEKFYNRFLYPMLRELSDEELVEIGKYFAQASIVSTNADATAKFDSTKLYTIIYMIEKNRRSPFIEPALLEQLQESSAAELSLAGTTLRSARWAREMLNPFLKIQAEMAEDYGIEVDESIFESIKKAVDENDATALNNTLKELENALAVQVANNRRDKSFLEKLQKWQGCMMLSSPSTWARNQVSNAIITVGSRVNAAIGKTLTLAVGKVEEKIKGQVRTDTATLDHIEDLLQKKTEDGKKWAAWTPKEIKEIKRFLTSINFWGTIEVNMDGKKATLDALAALDRLATMDYKSDDPVTQKYISDIREYFDPTSKKFKHLAMVFSSLREAVKGQYKILDKDIEKKLKETAEGKSLLKSLQSLSEDKDSIFNQVFDAGSKYDIAQEHATSSTAERVAALISSNFTNELYNKDFFGEDFQTNALLKRMAKVGNWTTAFLQKMLSDTYWVRKRTIYYLSRIMTQFGLTEADINFGDKAFVQYFSDAYIQASRDYMHKGNFIMDLERRLKKWSKPAWYAYKTAIPFASAAWNWAMIGVLDMSPIGLARSIIRYGNIETTIAKYADLESKGKDTTPARFAKYEAMRGIGRGTVGTVGMLAGLLFAMLGFARIDERDDKWKLSIGDGRVYIDITDLFGTQGIYSGIVIGGMLLEQITAKKNGNSADALSNLRKLLNAVIDTLAIGNPIEDVVTSLRYATGVGDYVTSLTTRPLETMLPSVCYAVEALSPYKIKYSTGFKGKLQKMYEQSTFGLVGAVSAISGWNLGIDFTIDPYSGERQLKYGTTALGSALLNALGTATQVKFRHVSDYEYEAARLGVGKSMLTGKYRVNGESVSLNRRDVIKANEFYGQLNKAELDRLYSNKVRYAVENPKTGKLEKLYYRQMTDKQKAAVIERLMSNNSGYAKIYTLTSSGKYKYFANESEFATLRSLGVTSNVYRATSKKSGFVKT